MWQIGPAKQVSITSNYAPRMTAADRRIEIAKRLFAGWSSGDADAPEPYFHPDGVLMDVCSGRFEGWPAIRDYFASALARSQDLWLIPDEFWASDTGLAVHYVMSGTVVNPATFGPEHLGRRWQVEVVSLLTFDGDRVILERDYHDRGSRARSLGITP